MRRLAIALVAGAFLAFTGVAAHATTFTSTSGGVDYSVYGTIQGTYGFYVSPSVLTTSENATSGISGSDFSLSYPKDSTTYLEAAIVIGFEHPWKLGNIVSVDASPLSSSDLTINLWLDTDTGNDLSNGGYFFSFSKTNKTLLTGDAGDSYFSDGDGQSLSGTSVLSGLGGIGDSQKYTLAELQSGAVTGIGPNTPAAFWIGVSGKGTAEAASICSVTVNTVPEPATLLLLCFGLVGLGVFKMKFRKA